MRTKACVHTLGGHTNTLADIQTQASNPQVSYIPNSKHIVNFEPQVFVFIVI